MTAVGLGPYRVSAFNTAHDSENKIHDDATARRFGFGGGLVPGVDVWGYMAHLPVERWGRAWLERGTAECRFLKPVYDGDETIVTAREEDGGLAITVESRGATCAVGRAALPEAAKPAPAVAGESRGATCAVGRAALPEAAKPAPAPAAYTRVAQRAEPRPPADEASLAVGTWLGLDPYPVTPEMAARYLADAHETAAIYAAEGLVHPRDILRVGNFAISRNVLLGPWIHTGSHIRHLAAVAVGSTLSARARVTRNYEHKGHKIVEIDALVLADGDRPAAHLIHTAIYRPRQVAAA